MQAANLVGAERTSAVVSEVLRVATAPPLS
jgi:hypothetical protein